MVPLNGVGWLRVHMKYTLKSLKDILTFIYAQKCAYFSITQRFSNSSYTPTNAKMHNLS